MLGFLHIPRTGGHARRFAMLDEIKAGTVKFYGHDKRVSDVGSAVTPVLFVRHPVARFISAWDHLYPHRELKQWDDVEHLALNIESAYPYLDSHLPFLFTRQTWWTEGAWTEGAGVRTVHWGRTEFLQRDMDLIVGRHVVLPTDNNAAPSHQHSHLSARAWGSLEEFYSGDLDLL